MAHLQAAALVPMMKADTGGNTSTVSRCLVEGWHMAFVTRSPKDGIENNWIYWQYLTFFPPTRWMRTSMFFVFVASLWWRRRWRWVFAGHTDLSFKSRHSPQAQLRLAHAAIFNPGGTWLTIGIASKSGSLHFYSRIHWKIHEMISPPPVSHSLQQKCLLFALWCFSLSHLTGGGCWTKSRKKKKIKSVFQLVCLEPEVYYP